MANNSATLRNGSKMAKNAIRTNILSRLNVALVDTIGDMQNKMMSLPGMTGNTKTSPAGATYDNDGAMIDITVVGSTDGTRAPIRSKLKSGQTFKKESIRYDGSEQSKTFTAGVDTSGNTSQSDNVSFLNSQQGGKDYRLVIVGASEYLGQQEVTDNYAWFENNVDRFFK